MNVDIPFCVGIGIDNLSDQINLANKIFLENRSILKNNNDLLTNFLYQTTNKNIINENYNNLDDVYFLKEKILEKSIDYLKSIEWYKEYFEYEVVNFWINEIISNRGFQSPHSHSGQLITGTFYVNVPKNSCPIIFENPLKDVLPLSTLTSKIVYNKYNSSSWTYSPTNGDLYIWPSNLIHLVPNTNFNGVRRSISFDVNVKGLKNGTTFNK